MAAGSARQHPPSAGAPATPPRSEARRGGISLASRLAATMLLVGSASLTIATVVGLNAGHSLGTRIVDESLELSGRAATDSVQGQASLYRRLVEQLAAGPVAAAAIEQFSAGIEQLSAIPRSTTQTQRQRLIEAYADRYIEPLRASGESLQLSDVVASDPAAVYLQAAYSLPEAPITSPIAVDDAGDGSEWSQVHAQIHPTLRNAVLQGGLQDLYLVDADTERIVYSGSKGPDLGTSLIVGPYGGSVVSRAATAAMETGGAVLTDLNFYRGVPGTPIGAAAAPVLDGTRLLGAIVVTYDAAVYTDGLQRLHDAAVGTEATRDLYLIGSDGRTRSDPQAYLADPTAFTEASQAAGLLTPAASSTIARNGTTVLVQPAADATLGAALDGQTDPQAVQSITGTEVLSAVTDVPLDGVTWHVVAEVGVEDADEKFAAFRSVLLIGATIFVVMLAFVAVAWGRSVMRPVRIISDRLSRTAVARSAASPEQPLTIPDRSPLELHGLADSFTAMARSLRRQQSELAQARAERLGVLGRMLPESIAQRISRGDVDSLEQVPSATVAVIVISGLGGLVDAGSGGDDRRLLDGLLAEIDDIALEHGVERIKVLGDAYFASCGHDRPYLDHAPRVVAFARDVAIAVRALAHDTSASLDTAIGISSGGVTVGVSSGTRVVYDVWGPTVTTAHDVARVADPGEVLLTDATRARLPEEVPLRPRQVGDEVVADGGGLWVAVPTDATAPTGGST